VNVEEEFEMGDPTKIRFNSYLLPSLGELVSEPKNVLSPLGLHFDRQPAPGEIAATGLLDSQGRLLARYQPLLAVLANPTSLVDLRFASGDHFQQFSLYYSQSATPPILLMNTTEGLLLEYPADTKAIVDGLMQFSSDSLVVSFDFDVSLPYGPALALTALVDLHRRGVARAFADVAPVGTISVSTPDIKHWIAHCPEDPQWITALIPQQNAEESQPGNVEEDLNHLVAQGICQMNGDSYALAGPALTFGNRMILIDNLYFVDIARVEADGQVGFASSTALQAGINDLLQIDFLEDEVAFKSLSPIGFILQIEQILEQGGQVLPVPSAAQASVDIPAGESISSDVWGLAVPGLESPFPLAESITIGRAKDCDLPLDDNRASRQHARLERRPDGYWISDLGSSNGVFLNGNRITEPIRLTLQDEIQIGDTTLKAVAIMSSPPQDATVINLKSPVIRTPDQPIVRKCPQCGNILSETARLCAKCGAIVQP
jgi:hypothetical protein